MIGGCIHPKPMMCADDCPLTPADSLLRLRIKHRFRFRMIDLSFLFFFLSRIKLAVLAIMDLFVPPAMWLYAQAQEPVQLPVSNRAILFTKSIRDSPSPNQLSISFGIFYVRERNTATLIINIHFSTHPEKGENLLNGRHARGSNVNKTDSVRTKIHWTEYSVIIITLNSVLNIGISQGPFLRYEFLN